MFAPRLPMNWRRRWRKFPNDREVLSLDPLDLGDVWRDILWIGETTGRRERAQEFVEKIGARLAEICDARRPDKTASARSSAGMAGTFLCGRPLGPGNDCARRRNQRIGESEDAFVSSDAGRDCRCGAGSLVDRALWL